MNLMTKKICANVCAAVMSITAVGICGELLLDNKSVGAEKAPAVQVKNVEAQSVKTTAATEVYDFVKFKKSSVDKYDMSYVQQKKQAKTTKKKASASEFTVEMPEDKGEYYDIKNDPANFTDTRSVADEYYTVNDIISGNIVTLNGHELLCQIVNSEIGGEWGEEAIKAQAVAAYTWVRFNDSIGAIPTVGLKSGYSSKIERCINAVEGQTVMYNGNIINAVYSASTAGYSTTSEDIWGVSYPYLKRVKSEFDDKDPNWGIEATYTKDEVKERIESQTDIKLSDDVKNWFKIDSAFSGKYISGVTIDGHTSCTYDGSEARITGITLCNLFDVKSNAMEISYKDGVFTFKSYGWGHGVGMSLWDARLPIMQYIGYNITSKVFSNYGLRSAITYAIDRDHLATDIMGGFAQPAVLPASPQAPFYDGKLANTYGYNLTKFSQQLESASVEDMDNDGTLDLYVPSLGYAVSVAGTMIVCSSSYQRVEAATEVVNALNALGFKITLKTLELSEFRQALQTGNFDLYYGEIRLSNNFDLTPFFSASGSMCYGGLDDSVMLNLCTQALANNGNSYNLYKRLCERGYITPVLFKNLAVYTTRGSIAHPTDYIDWFLIPPANEAAEG